MAESSEGEANTQNTKDLMSFESEPLQPGKHEYNLEGELENDDLSTTADMSEYDSNSEDEVDWDEFAQYTYESLQSPTTIRILCIEPGMRTDPLKCRLGLADINTDPVYEALSYVWSPETPVHNIICNDARHKVRQNLFDALRTFRQHDRCRYIWADALCINQNDIVGRGLQVQLMGQIYMKAAQTLVWLGRECPSLVKAAFGYLCQLLRLKAAKMASITPSEKQADFQAIFESNYNTYRWKGCMVAPSPDCMEPPDENKVNTWLDPPLVALFRNPYFRRGWVIQEITLSSEHWSIFWGDGEIGQIWFAPVVRPLR
jgi:hypothetical protein